LKIQVHRDRGKEFADNRRFALATNIEVYATRKARGSAGQKLPLRKVRFWRILLKKSKIERLPKSRESRYLDVSTAAIPR
jgi:hypothetical protein